MSRGGVGGSEWGRVVEVGGDRGRGGARWEVGVGGSGRVVIWSRCGEVMGWGGGGWGVGGHGPGSLAHRLGLTERRAVSADGAIHPPLLPQT